MKNSSFFLLVFVLFVLRLNSAALNPQGFRLINFSAEKKDQLITLKWITAEEVDVNYFIIERSTDAVSFDSIGTISAKGHMNSSQNEYEFPDAPSRSGLYYYRLKQRSKTTGCKTSKIILMQYESDDEDFNLYPNPSNGVFTLNYSVERGEKAVFTIHSLRGKKLAEYPVDCLANSIFFVLELDKGIYYGDLSVSNRPSQRFKILIN